MKTLFAAAVLAAVAPAIIREETYPTQDPSSLTLDSSHWEHTTDSWGAFVHPFEQVGPEVQSIFYQGSKTFSTRIYRVSAPSKHLQYDERAFSRSSPDHSESFLDTVVSLFRPSGVGERYTLADLQNYYNLSYLGDVFVGSPLQSFKVVWDTGSGSFLVRSTECKSCP